MTNKQYEHLGKAIEMATSLAKSVQALGELRDAITEELSFFMSKEEARNAVAKIMTDYLPSYRMGDLIKHIVEEAGND